MKENIKLITYECKKCNKTVHFMSDEEYSTQCKTCKNEMVFRSERNYNPKNGLSAINARNAGSSIDRVSAIINNLAIECPYCHSTNTKKISGLSKAGSVALFGIFAVGKVSKQWHCNNCNSDF